MCLVPKFHMYGNGVNQNLARGYTGSDMDIQKLDKTVDALIRTKQFAEAEAILSEARQEATDSADPNALDWVLSHFVFLCWAKEPPDVLRAKQFCLEREAAREPAYNKYRTARTYYWPANDHPRTVMKAREAVEKATDEGDTNTRYSALSLLGLALLDLDRSEEAGATLIEIYEMVRQRQRIVVGDETLFLERAHTGGLDRSILKSTAPPLAPVCRDKAFAERLPSLAREN